MELIVVGFQGRYRAAQVLTELRQQGVNLFDLDQAITVSWEDRRNFVVQQSINLSRSEGSRWARLWGGFIRATLYNRLPNALAWPQPRSLVERQRLQTEILTNLSHMIGGSTMSASLRTS